MTHKKMFMLKDVTKRTMKTIARMNQSVFVSGQTGVVKTSIVTELLRITRGSAVN